MADCKKHPGAKRWASGRSSVCSKCSHTHRTRYDQSRPGWTNKPGRRPVPGGPKCLRHPEAKRWKSGPTGGTETACSVCAGEATKKWLANNKERRRAVRRLRESTPEGRGVTRAYARKWYHANKHRVSPGLRGRMRRYGTYSDGSVGKSWKTIVLAYDNRCAYCLTGKYEHMDHVVPLSRGGSHTAINVVPSCASCNKRKKTQVWLPRPARYAA